MADLYVYFYEQGVKLLKQKGYLSYISSNKYFRAGYGEKLRKYLGEKGKVEFIIDFGDAAVFEAIAYPSIILLSKPVTQARSFSKQNKQRNDFSSSKHQVCVLNWDIEESVNKFTSVYKNKSFYVAQKELKADGWRLESPEVLRLLDKLRNAGILLNNYINGKVYIGIKTALNEAYIIDQETKDKLISQDLSSSEVIKAFIKGKDIKRWNLTAHNKYLIKIESSENKRHLWSNEERENAEMIFANEYPAIYQRFNLFKEKLIKRSDQGRYFWELRSCSYWSSFEKPKILFPDIAPYAQFSIDFNNNYVDMTGFIIPTSDLYLLAIMNSSIVLYFYTMISSQVRGGYLRYKRQYVEQIPIPKASETDKKAIEKLVQKCLDAKGVGVEEWEAEIDDIVAHLYGLNEEEVKIIRGV